MEKNDGPVTTLRDRSLKASIWRNQSDKGEFYSCTLSRVYEDRKTGELRDSTSFSGKELMRVSELSRRAHNTILKLDRERDRRGAKGDVAPQQARDRDRR
ncbi:MAG: hypothetical protein ACFB03_17730 [Paracoccaceae bacterium]